MKGQDLYIIIIGVFLLVSVTLVCSADPTELSLNQRFPDKDETEVCGSIRNVIKRDSRRFQQILIRNTNDQVEYIDDDARRMTSRTKRKLDVLASLVISEWSNDKVRVIQAWTDQVHATDPTSLHYEGRSLRLQTKDFQESKLARLAGLAIQAGFDWVEYNNSNYIRVSVIQVACQKTMDLVFLLDNSGSVGEPNFKKVKDFVKYVIDIFNIGKDGTHVAVVTYDTYTYIEFNLVKYFTKTELRNAVDDIKYHGFLSYTGEALNTVRQKVFTQAAGMRIDDAIPKVLVLLTDGYSNSISSQGPATRLRDLGVSIFSIGIGSDVSVSELNGIASDPDEEYVFRLQSFDQLANFVDKVSFRLCSVNVSSSAAHSKKKRIKTYKSSAPRPSRIEEIAVPMDMKNTTSYPSAFKKGTQSNYWNNEGDNGIKTSSIAPNNNIIVTGMASFGQISKSSMVKTSFTILPSAVAPSVINPAIHPVSSFQTHSVRVNSKNTKGPNKEEVQMGFLVALVTLLLCLLISLCVIIYQRRLIHINKGQRCHQCEALANTGKKDTESSTKTMRRVENTSKHFYMNEDALYDVPDSGNVHLTSKPVLSIGQEYSTYMSLKDNREPENVYQSLQPNI